jgi:hypothetical protein
MSVGLATSENRPKARLFESRSVREYFRAVGDISLLIVVQVLAGTKKNL